MPQEAEPTAMVGEPMKVTFVRSGRRAGARVQEWRSEATGRVHEVLEARSDRPGADLRLGDAGYLWFRGGRVHVTAAPAAPSGRGPERRVARADVSRARPALRRRGPRGRWTRWLLPLALLVAVLWQLLAGGGR